MSRSKALTTDFTKFSAKGRQSIERILGVMGISSMVIVSALAVFTGVDVFLRKALNKPIAGSYEVGEYSLAMMVCLGLGYTELKDMHVRLEIIPERVKGRAASALKILSKVSLGFFAAMLAVFAWGNLVHAVRSGDVSPGELSIPVAILWAGLVVGAFILACVAIARLIEATWAFFRGDSG